MGAQDTLEALVPDVPWLGVLVAEIETGLVVRANPAFLEMLGYSQEEVAAGMLNVRAITPVASGAATERAVAQLKSAGRMQPIEKTYLHKSGRPVNVWVTGLQLADAPELALSYVLDVTERRRFEEALQESEVRARRFAEASFEGLFIHDEGIVVDANGPLTVMFATTREAMIGRGILDFAAPESHDLILRNVAAQYQLPYEAVGLRADGTTFPMEVVGKPLPMGGRTVRVTALRDLTSRKRTEAALREAELALQERQRLESLGVLAGGIAHDFNNILAVVLAFSAVARRQIADDSPALSSLEEIETAVFRASDLTRQMLVYAGRSGKNVGPVDVNDVTRQMARLLSASFPKKIHVQLALAAELPVLVADIAQVQQVVMNLLTNAAEAIGDAQGTIRIATAVVTLAEGGAASPVPGEVLAGGSYVAVEVTDTGAGMDEATRARIFDPFFTTKATGRGLGLSAMLGILRGHRGGLTIETAIGQGTTFRVYFPSPPVTPQRVRGSSAQGTPTKAGAILIAEDEPSLRRSLRALLESVGFAVLEAANGKEAVDVFQEHHAAISLVILDLVMPEMDGRQALGAIKEIEPGARVLLTSGFDRDEVLEGVRSEVVGFVAKPYAAESLLEMVQALVRTTGG